MGRPDALTPRPVWRTDAGDVVSAVTAAEMRAIDRVATDGAGLSLLQMMENAGRSLAAQALAQLGRDWRGATVLVLAGGGGNGGGGISAARHLANRGIDVRLVLAEPERLAAAPGAQRRIFASTRGRELRRDALGDDRPSLVLDALIGYGLRDAPGGAVADLITWTHHCGAPILSLDVPSGVEATTGDTPGLAVSATSTLTLALPKTGLRTERTGALWLADLGIPVGVYEVAGIPYADPFGLADRIRLHQFGTNV